MPSTIMFYGDGAMTDEHYVPWQVLRIAKSGVTVHPNDKDRLPADESRLLLYTPTQAFIIDPCPPNWRNATLSELQSLARPI